MAATDEQRQWVSRVLGVESAAGKPGPAGDGLAVWQRERAGAIERLRKLGSAIGNSGDPEAREALILLQGIIKNLTMKPDSPKAVTEIEHWLQTDDIFEDVESPNPFGIELNVRAPLLEALGHLRAEFTG